MAEKIKKISTLIESQLPGFISSEYEQFSKFVEKYYEQLESTGNPLDIIQNIENYRDINFYEKNLLNQKTILSGNILANSSSITVADASSFPKENGYIRIGNEICFYKERTNNQFLEVSRGVSGNTTLGDLYNSSEFVTTQSAPHYTGDEVYNISNLFLYAFIKNFEEEYLGAFPEKYLKGEVDKRTLIKNINKFYKAKGTDRSIKFIFNSIVSRNESEVVEVYNPKDFTLKASVSDWVTKYALKVKVLSGDPLKLIGNVITQSLDDYDKTISFASAVVDNVVYLGKFDNEDLYEVVLAPSTINGNFKIAARTTLRSNLSISADTGDRINLFSTMGFPKQGKVLIGNEVISFNDKNVNQLIINDRQNSVSYTEGISVYSFSTVEGSHEEGTVRLLTLGVLYNLLPEKALPYSETGDLIQVSESGFETRDPVIFDVRKNLTRWFVNTNFTKVNSIVPGVNSQINDLIADVSAIYEDDQYYYIASSSFPSHNNLLTLEITESLSDQKLLKLIRKYPTTTTEVYETGTRDVGILVDGSPVFGCKDFDFVTFGKIENIKIESKGVGYAAPPTVLINEQPGKAISVLSGETVNSITVTSEDTYSSDPVIRITSGEGAILSPVVTEGRISSINVVNSGRYYSSPPTIRIIDELGKGNFAEYEAILDNEGKIASCRRITGGRFYTRGNVIITVEARGKGAQATAKVKRWVKNRYEKLKNNLDTNNSYVFPSFDGSKNYGYGVVANPVILRKRLGDSISAIYQETTPLQHSSIIGYAYDGNPIYGPYGYSNPVNSSSSITRLSSGYLLNVSRPNGPSISQYPLGTFVDDYTWTPSVNSGKTELDSNNGRFCVTPDYPNGIYAYFITINQSNTPVFPYVLGNNFYSLPVDSNYNSIISQDDIPVSARRLKTEDYEINGNDFYGYIQDVKGGNISSATVYESLENFSVNSFVSINDFLTEGAGAAAVVSSVKGKQIVSIESNQTKAIQFTTVENSYLFEGDTITQEVTGATGVLIGNSVNENNFVLSNVQGEFNTQNVINSETKVVTLILNSNSIFTQGATITLTDGEGNIGSDIATGEILEGITRQNSLKVKVISGEFILNDNYFLKSTNLGDTSRTQILNIISLSENLNIFDINDNIAIVETNGFHNIAVGDKVNVDILPDDTETETLYFVRKRLYQEAILNPVNHSSVIVDTGIGSADILNTGADYQSGVYENVELIFQDISKARTDIGRPDDLNNAKATITVSNPAGLGYGGIASIVITNKGSNYKINDVLTVSDSSLNRLAGSTNIQRLYIAVNHVGFAEQNTTLKLSNVTNLSVDDYLKLNEEIVKITSVNVQQKTVGVLRGQKNTRPKNHYDKLKVELFEGNYKFTPNFGPFGEGISKPLIVDYDSDNKKIFVSFNYGAQSPERILLSSSFFDASTPAKLVTIKTVENPKFKLEFSKDTENNLITNPIVNIQKYYKYKFDTSHFSMVDTYLDFSSSSNYNIFTEEKFVSSISPGNAGSFVNIKLGFGPNISSNDFQTRQRINFSNYFYFIKVSPNVNTDNSFLRIIDDPLTGEKVVTYTTDTKFVYELNSVPEYDGSGQMLYTTTSQFAIGKINSLAITNSGNDYKRLPIVEGVLPTASKECIVDPVYDTVNKNIAGFKILNQGSNYSKPTVVITDGDGINYKFDCFV
ncbi:MAG: YHYH protein, partial [Candidatus Marinimicrobia bacterium]|nr:YHYH protein [Candidatus Neomarinimicrobiota bacterium]